LMKLSNMQGTGKCGCALRKMDQNSKRSKGFIVFITEIPPGSQLNRQICQQFYKNMLPYANDTTYQVSSELARNNRTLAIHLWHTNSALSMLLNSKSDYCVDQLHWSDTNLCSLMEQASRWCKSRKRINF